MFLLNDEFTCAPIDEIDFILFMRSLWIMADRGVILNGHGAMGESNGKSLAHGPLSSDRTGDMREYLFDGGFNFQLRLLTEQIRTNR